MVVYLSKISANYSIRNNNKKNYIKLVTKDGVFRPTETTKFILEAVIKTFPKKKVKVLDLGCGNGVVGIYLLKKFKNISCMSFADTSIKAIKNAKENCELNKISKKRIKFFKSNIFNNIHDLEFDIIINDISGISYEIAKISKWFKGVPCETGEDGTKLTLCVLRNFSFFLKSKGILILPLISLSNVKKIMNFFKKEKLKIKYLSTNDWPIPNDMYKHLQTMKRLRGSNKINFYKKYGLLIANTKIVQIKLN